MSSTPHPPATHSPLAATRFSSHSGTHPPPSIHLSFQQLTQYPFCKSFCLIYIHLMGGCTPLVALPLTARPAQCPQSRLPRPQTAQSGLATAPRDRCSSSGQGFLPPPPAARS